METTYRRFTGLNILAIALVIPAFYVIMISLLKYGLGIDGPFDASQPMLESWGIKDPPGWNISMVIVLGPILSILITVLQVLSIEWSFTSELFRIYIFIRKRWLPIAIALFSGLVLATLAIYLFLENINHP